MAINMVTMGCQFCSHDFKESEIQEHHIHPRFMDNKKGDGKKIYLCEKCHTILHLKIPGILWRNIPWEKKGIVIEEVKKYTGEKII